MNTKHTRGPWEVRQFAGRFNVWPAHRKNDSTAVAYDVAEEDAMLIAAAPELLEALTACMSFIEAHEDHYKDGATLGPTYATARAAIAKAQGQQSAS